MPREHDVAKEIGVSALAQAEELVRVRGGRHVPPIQIVGGAFSSQRVVPSCTYPQIVESLVGSPKDERLRGRKPARSTRICRSEIAVDWNRSESLHRTPAHEFAQF